MTSALPCVAVVDDEALVRTSIGRLLRLADYRVVGYSSGEEFLAAIETQRPDCVLLDIHLPGLSGLDVQERLRATHIDIPVVFITASDDPDLTWRALKAQGRLLLRKPFSDDELLAAIDAAIHGRPGDGS